MALKYWIGKENNMAKNKNLIDISYLDKWLMENEYYSQEDRELIVEAIEEYIIVMKNNVFKEKDKNA